MCVFLLIACMLQSHRPSIIIIIIMVIIQGICIAFSVTQNCFTTLLHKIMEHVVIQRETILLRDCFIVSNFLQSSTVECILSDEPEF